MIDIQHKICTLKECLRHLRSWRLHNTSIVFTNGCFDILHQGHISFLQKAKHLGDKLIVGLNTDKSVKALKGPKRPVLDQRSRALVLASLLFTDRIILFDDDTPLKPIEAIKPDILVKGGDYKPEDVVGADTLSAYGGKLVIIPLLCGYSTSIFVEKLKT